VFASSPTRLPPAGDVRSHCKRGCVSPLGVDVPEGYALAPVAPADRVLTEPAYRLEAQSSAQNTMARYRALLPAGTAAPAWDAAAEQRLADGLLAAVLGANRWVLSFDHTQRLLVTPVPRHAAIIDPKNAENRVTIMCG
jgi:hypothetical protein